MHLEVYRQRPEMQAVVHAHPPVATAFAVAGIPLDRAVLAEVVTTLGSVPIAEYATPSTKELPEAVRKYVKAHDGMLLANHGALTLGSGCVFRVLQDGDDRALRQHQLRGADARRRAAVVARRGDPPAGAARAIRHRRASADLPGARSRSTGDQARSARSSFAPRSLSGERLVACPRRRRRCRRGNSANIPRTHGIDRRRGQKSEIVAVAVASFGRLRASRSSDGARVGWTGNPARKL